MKRQLVLLVTVVLWNPDIVEAQSSPANVLIGKPIVRLVREFNLPSLCGTSKQIEACTAFVGQVLRYNCEPAESQWHIKANAQFIPVMYVLGPEHVLHERVHIKDIEVSVTEYLTELGGHRFDSAGACQRAAELEASRFPRTMDRFKEDSNALRHPQPGLWVQARHSERR